MKKVKVVEIYFEEDSDHQDFLQALPSLLLENGKIKKPRILGGIPVWATDEEWKRVIEDVKSSPWWKFWKK